MTFNHLIEQGAILGHHLVALPTAKGQLACLLHTVTHQGVPVVHYVCVCVCVCLCSCGALQVVCCCGALRVCVCV